MKQQIDRKNRLRRKLGRELARPTYDRFAELSPFYFYGRIYPPVTALTKPVILVMRNQEVI